MDLAGLCGNLRISVLSYTKDLCREQTGDIISLMDSVWHVETDAYEKKPSLTGGEMFGAFPFIKLEI